MVNGDNPEMATAPALLAVEALDQAFQMHHEMVFRAAYRILGNTSDSEDVLQTVFLRLMRRDSEAEPVENLESYLRRSAVNASLDLLRDRRPTQQVSLDSYERTGYTPDRRHSAGEIRECLRKALASLNPRAAELFSLRYFEGYGNGEIARMLGISESGVAVTLHRTRQQLQKQIRAELGENR